MKTFSILSLTLGMALVIGTSCNNQEGGSSATPVDSTNETGAAPVQYSGGNPDQITDTTLLSHPAAQRAQQDNANARSMQDAQGKNANGNQPESNTTDPKTTQGSSK